jgi:hypothetical protein
MTEHCKHDWTRYRVDVAYLHDQPVPVDVIPVIPVSICTKCHLTDLWLFTLDEDVHLTGHLGVVK